MERMPGESWAQWNGDCCDDMKEDAYSALASMMREAGRPSGPMGPIHLRLGTVLAADPQKVDVAGTIQEAERFYISHRLVKDHQELLELDCSGVNGNLSIQASCGYGSHSSMSVSSGTLNTPRCVAAQAEPVLKAGDEVLLLTEDDQTFYLMDKVVKAG